MKFEDMLPIAIMILVAGIILGIGADILDNVNEEVRVSTAVTDGKDQWVGSNVTSKTLTFLPDTDGVWSAMVIKNDSGGEILHLDNYTFSTTVGTVVLTDDGNLSYGGATLNLTYSYERYTGVAHDTVSNATTGIGELASWMPTIALVLAAAIIIGLVLFNFGFFGKRKD